MWKIFLKALNALCKKSYDKSRQCIKKQRHHFADKGLSSQSYVFSSSYVWMWDLDYKEGCTEELRLLNCDVGEDSSESLGQQDQISQSSRKSSLNICWKDWFWSWSSSTLATWCKESTHWKDTDAGKDWRQGENEASEDEMVGWHHRLNEHEFVQALGDGKGQGNLAWCSPWGHKVSGMTEWLNNNWLLNIWKV